jgi:hypothetical protein
MAFDPTLPQTNALISSAELRSQFTGPFVVRALARLRNSGMRKTSPTA